MKREEINARIEELRGGIQYLAAFDELDDEQRSAWDEATVEFEELSERAQDIATREAAAERAAKVPTIQVITRQSTEDTLNDRSATPQQLADTLTRSLEDRGVDADGMDRVRGLLRAHQADTAWTRNLTERSTDTYSTAFAKAITGRGEFLTLEERTSLAVGTSADGGYLVPTHLDPTLIFTNNGSSNNIRAIARNVTLTAPGANVWNGVTTAGSTFSFDAELTEVSDDSPQFGRVSIPIFKAQGFIQGAVEMLEDTTIGSEIGGLIADAKDRLEGTAYATGSGSGAPTGIFTALDANTNVELTSTTAATIGLVDLQNVYKSVPVRWRGRGKWLMAPTYLGQIQALGSALGASYSTDITQAYTSSLLGHQVVESDDAPTTQTTTVRDNEIVFGDFSNYVIVDKPGSMSVQFIPVMFNTTTNLPDGRVGWYCYWRTGADSVNDVAFRLLQDKTSA